jgi:hypothetical protein
LSHGIEGSPNKEGKEFVKIVDGLANVATKHDGWHLRPSISAPPKRVDMISIPGGRIIDFVLEAFTFELPRIAVFSAVWRIALQVYRSPDQIAETPH